jgi:hypothetical protein
MHVAVEQSDFTISVSIALALVFPARRPPGSRLDLLLRSLPSSLAALYFCCREAHNVYFFGFVSTVDKVLVER